MGLVVKIPTTWFGLEVLFHGSAIDICQQETDQ